MLKLSVLILLSTSIFAAQTCNYADKKVMLKQKYQTCTNINHYASLPKVRLYSESGAAGYQLIAQVKGYVHAYNRNTINFEEFTTLEGATLRVDATRLPRNYNQATQATLKLDEKSVAHFGDNLSYGKYTLNNVVKYSFNTESYTMLAPVVYNQYIYAAALIDSILVEPMKCDVVEGEVSALESCQTIWDEHQEECDCSYTLLK